MPKTWEERCKIQLQCRGYAVDEIDTAIKNLRLAYDAFLDSGCADQQFATALETDDESGFAQRLGEMLLYERLNHVGCRTSSKNSGPDLRLEYEGQIVWLELVTPSAGKDGEIHGLFERDDPLSPNAEDADMLRRRLLLRVCTGIESKLRAFEKYRKQGLVAADDACVIVVNDALLCPPNAREFGVSLGADSGVGGRSLVHHAVFGDASGSWEPTGQAGGYHIVHRVRDKAPNRPEPSDDGGDREPVPVCLFRRSEDSGLREWAERATQISAVMQVSLRADYGHLMMLRDHAEKVDRVVSDQLYPGALAVNPNAQIPLSPRLGEKLMQMSNLERLSIEAATRVAQRRLAMLMGRDDWLPKVPG